MIDVIVFSICFAITGHLIAGPLSFPGEVLAWWPGLVKWITRTTSKSPADWNPVQWWFSKITYLCGKCIAGNLAFWYAVLVLEPGSGFISVSLSIFLAYILDRHYG